MHIRGLIFYGLTITFHWNSVKRTIGIIDVRNRIKKPHTNVQNTYINVSTLFFLYVCIKVFLPLLQLLTSVLNLYNQVFKFA